LSVDDYLNRFNNGNDVGNNSIFQSSALLALFKIKISILNQTNL